GGGRSGRADRDPEARSEPRPPGGSSGASPSREPRPPELWTRVLLEAVAEKTGYPAEMLELDMRLDADLGIDSIKRVENLSAVQERLPETRAIGPEHAGTLQTRRQIVEFLAAAPCPVPASRPVPAPTDV